MSIDVNAAILVKGSTYVTNRAINIPRTKRDTDLHGSVDRLVAQRFERVAGGRSRSAPFSLEFHLEFVPRRK